MAEREIAEHVRLARREQRPAPAREPVGEEAQVPAICLERVLREPVLQPEPIAELVEEREIRG
jgi:hypothetical protein